MSFETFIRGFAEQQHAAETRKLERAANQQAKRAARMSSKIGRGNRRAAKASMRAATLQDQVAARKIN